MSGYTVTSTITGLAGGENIFVELHAPANVQCYVKRIRVSDVETTASDGPLTLVVRRLSSSANAASLSAFTPKSMLSDKRSAATTAGVGTGPNTAQATFTIDIPLQLTKNSKGSIDWVARDEDDYIWSTVNGYIDINVNNGAAGAIDVLVEVEFGE